MKTKLTLLTFLICCNVYSFAQQNEAVITISKIVGPTIDQHEKIKYGLFPEINSAKYVEGAFYKGNSDSIFLSIKFTNDEHIKFFFDHERYEKCKELITGNILDHDTVPEFTTDGYKIVILNPYLGKTIDLREKMKYHMFDELERTTFYHAQILLKENGTYILRLTAKDGTVRDKKISADRIKNMKKRTAVFVDDPAYFSRGGGIVTVTAVVGAVILVSVVVVGVISFISDLSLL